MFVKDIYDAVYPVLFATASFGLSSILIKTHNTRKLQTYNYLKVLNVIYLSVFTYFMYMAICDFKQQQLQTQYAFGVTKIGIVFQFLSQIAVTYVIYIVNITKSPKILSSIEDIKKIDEIFKNLGEDLNYGKHFIHETFVISTGIVIILGRSIFTYEYMSKIIFTTSQQSHLVLSFPSFVSYLIQNNFVLLIILIQERFGIINKLLNNLTNDGINEILKVKVSQEYQMKHNLKRIELLMELHDSLTDVGNKINDSFTIQILACLTAQFLTEVFTVFYLYYESLILKNKTSATICAFWTIWTTLEIFFVTITCHLTSKQARNTGIVIHKVLMTENNPCIKRKLMSFSQQVCHKPLQFTACGLFTIDATLIFTIAGAAATYLLIMLQFQEGIEAQCSNIRN